MVAQRTGRCPLVITDHKPFARIDEYCYIETFKYFDMSIIVGF